MTLVPRWPSNIGVSENSIPLNPMVNDHYPLLNGYNWECTLFSDKPIYDGSRAAKDQLPNSFGQIHSAEIHFSGLAGWTKHLNCCGEGGLWQLSHCGCVQVYD